MPPSPHHPSSSIPLLQTRLKQRAADHFIPTVSTQGWTREDLEALLSSPSTEILRVFGGQELSPQAWGNRSNLLRAQCMELSGEKGTGESN